jgi:hypothetical protein
VEVLSFYSGLKELLKRLFYLFLIFSFILVWILILTFYQFTNPLSFLIIITFGGGLLFFELIGLVISLFKPIEDIRFYIWILIFILSLFLALFFANTVFFPTSDIAFIIMLNVNMVFTAFFAFKFCMDSATKVDDYLYGGKRSRVVLRVIGFIIFGFLNLWLLRITSGFFARFLPPFQQAIGLILRTIFWVNLILISFVLIRLIITGKFAAYITLFFLLTAFYTLYLFFDFIFGHFFGNETSDPYYLVISFTLDIFLFLYILGTVYGRIDYLKEKLKFFRVDTLAIFLVTMKLYVQIAKIVDRTVAEDYLILQEWGIFIIFMLFTLIFGIHSIFAHKYEKAKKVV